MEKSSVVRDGFCRNGKICAFVISVLFSVVSVKADGGTAYLALKAAQKDADRSASLIEVAGERGEPQPQEWKVVLRDPTAREEFERSWLPATSSFLSALRSRNMRQVTSRRLLLGVLNLDSDRAFEIANKQAIAKGQLQLGRLQLAGRCRAAPQRGFSGFTTTWG